MNNFTQQAFLGGVFPLEEVLYAEKYAMNVASIGIPNNSATNKMGGLIITMPDKQANHWVEFNIPSAGVIYYLSPHKPHFFFGSYDKFKQGLLKPTNNWAASDFITLAFF